ncbi:conserved Plasmodium protein, unknown function [Plasmodium relictum]|uniref:Uncharacterized protein n=1 Tax=Plasmodium relictum TaxID=85471 RepID=A0A1J1HC51_PLARL|nr:conserved Plasmodium protein, unknown function [Plasmodium relictum]CRH01145.1 conserved Plasmodium protein, unknown function [Plasmodium relictum]
MSTSSITNNSIKSLKKKDRKKFVENSDEDSKFNLNENTESRIYKKKNLSEYYSLKTKNTVLKQSLENKNNSSKNCLLKRELNKICNSKKNKGKLSIKFSKSSVLLIKPKKSKITKLNYLLKKNKKQKKNSNNNANSENKIHQKNECKQNNKIYNSFETYNVDKFKKNKNINLLMKSKHIKESKNVNNLKAIKRNKDSNKLKNADGNLNNCNTYYSDTSDKSFDKNNKNDDIKSNCLNHSNIIEYNIINNELHYFSENNENKSSRNINYDKISILNNENPSISNENIIYNKNFKNNINYKINCGNNYDFPENSSASICNNKIILNNNCYMKEKCNMINCNSNNSNEELYSGCLSTNNNNDNCYNDDDNINNYNTSSKNAFYENNYDTNDLNKNNHDDNSYLPNQMNKDCLLKKSNLSSDVSNNYITYKKYILKNNSNNSKMEKNINSTNDINVTEYNNKVNVAYDLKNSNMKNRENHIFIKILGEDNTHRLSINDKESFRDNYEGDIKKIEYESEYNVIEGNILGDITKDENKKNLKIFDSSYESLSHLSESFNLKHLPEIPDDANLISSNDNLFSLNDKSLYSNSNFSSSSKLNLNIIKIEDNISTGNYNKNIGKSSLNDEEKSHDDDFSVNILPSYSDTVINMNNKIKIKNENNENFTLGKKKKKKKNCSKLISSNNNKKNQLSNERSNKNRNPKVLNNYSKLCQKGNKGNPIQNRKNTTEKKILSSSTILKKKKEKRNLNKLSNSDNYFKTDLNMKNKMSISHNMLYDSTNNCDFFNFSNNSTDVNKSIKKEDIDKKYDSMQKIFFSYSLNSEKSDNVSIIHVDSLEDIRTSDKNHKSSNNLNEVNITNDEDSKKIKEANNLLCDMNDENKEQEKYLHNENNDQIDKIIKSNEENYYNEDRIYDDIYVRDDTYVIDNPYVRENIYIRDDTYVREDTNDISNTINDKTKCNEEIKTVSENDNDSLVRITNNYTSNIYYCDENNEKNYNENNNCTSIIKKDVYINDNIDKYNSNHLNVSYNFNEYKKNDTNLKNDLFSTNLNDSNENFKELREKNNDHMNNDDNFKIDFVYSSSSASDSISENEEERMFIKRKTSLKNKNEEISKNTNDDFYINYYTIRKNNLVNKKINICFSDNDIKRNFDKSKNIKSDNIKVIKEDKEKMKKNSNSNNEKSKPKKDFLKDMKNKNNLQKNKEEKQKEISSNKNHYVVNSRHVKYYPLEKLNSMKVFLNEINIKKNEMKSNENFYYNENKSDENEFNKRELSENELNESSNKKNKPECNKNAYKEYENAGDFNINEEKNVKNIIYDESLNENKFLNDTIKYKRTNSFHNASVSDRIHIEKLNSSMNNMYDLKDEDFIIQKKNNNNTLNEDIIKYMKLESVGNAYLNDNTNTYKRNHLIFECENKNEINKNFITGINKINEDVKFMYVKDDNMNLKYNSNRNFIYCLESNNKNSSILNREDDDSLIKYKEGLTADRKNHINKIEQLLQNFIVKTKQFEEKEKNINTKSNDNHESYILIKEEDDQDRLQKSENNNNILINEIINQEDNILNNEINNYEKDENILSNEIINYENENILSNEILSCKSFNEINNNNEEINCSYRVIEETKITNLLNYIKNFKYNEDIKSKKSKLLFSEEEKLEHINTLNCLYNNVNLLKNENDNLKVTNNIFRSENDNLGNKYDALKNEVDNLKNENYILRNKIGNFSNENCDLKNKNDNLKSENCDLKNENDNLKSENCDLKNENDNLKSENDNLENENCDLKNKNDNLKSENCDLKNKNDNLKSENCDLKNKNDNLKSENDNLENENCDLKNKNDNLKSENDNFEKENCYLKNKNDNLKNENDNLKSENDNLKNENDILKSENDILKSENDNLKSENDNLKSEMVNLNLSTICKDKKFNLDKENYKMEIDMLKCEIENINNEKIKLLESSEIAENEFNESKKKLKNFKYNNEKYMKEIETLKEERHIIKQENENLKKNIEEIEREYKLLLNDKENLKTEKMSNILKINYLEEQIKKQKIDLKDLEKELKNKDKQLLIKEEEIINQKYLIDEVDKEKKMLESKLNMYEIQNEKIISKYKEEKKIELEDMKNIIECREKEPNDMKKNEVLLKKEIKIYEENMSINENKIKYILEESKNYKNEIEKLREQVKQLKEENHLIMHNIEPLKNENNQLKNENFSFEKSYIVLRDEREQKGIFNIQEKVKNKENNLINNSSITNSSDGDEKKDDVELKINKEILNNLFKENKNINSLNNSCLKFFENKKDLLIKDGKHNKSKLLYKNYDKVCSEINNLDMSKLQVKYKDLLKEYIFLELLISEYEKSNVYLHKKNKELNKKLDELEYSLDKKFDDKGEKLSNKRMSSEEYHIFKEELDKSLNIYESNKNIKVLENEVKNYKNMCIELDKSNKKLFDKLEKINKLLLGEKDSIYEKILKKALEIMKHVDIINEEISTFKENKNFNDIDYSNILLYLNTISIDILFINTNICYINEFINENHIYLDIHNFKNLLFDFSVYIMRESNSYNEDTANDYVTNKKENIIEKLNENKIEERSPFIDNNRNNNSKKIEFRLSNINSMNLNHNENNMIKKEENHFNFVEDFTTFFEICFSSDLFLILIHLCKGINEINSYIRKGEIENCINIINFLQNTTNEILNFYSYDGNTFFLDSYIDLFDILKNYLNKIQNIIKDEKINKMHKIIYEIYRIKKIIRFIIFSFFNFHINAIFNISKNDAHFISYLNSNCNTKNNKGDDNNNILNELNNKKNNNQIEENKFIIESVNNCNSLISLNNLSDNINNQPYCDMNNYLSNYFNSLNDSKDFFYNKKSSCNWMKLEFSSFYSDKENKDLNKIVNDILEFNYNSHIIPNLISNYADEMVIQIKENGKKDTLTENENYASFLFKKIYEHMKLNNLIINSNNFLEYFEDELLKKKLYNNFFFKKNHFINIDIIHKYLNIIFKLNIGIDYEYFYQQFLIILNKIILQPSSNNIYNSYNNTILNNSKTVNNSHNKSALLSINLINKTNNKNNIYDDLSYPLLDIDNKFMSILFHMWQKIEINYFSKLNSNNIHDSKLNNNLGNSYNLRNIETNKLKISDRTYKSEILSKKENFNIHKKNSHHFGNNNKENTYVNSFISKSNTIKEINKSDNLMETYLKLMVFDIFKCKNEEKIIGIDDFIFMFKQLHINIKTSVIYAIWCIIIGSKNVNLALKERIPVSLFIKKAYATNPSLIFYEYCKTKIQLKEAKKNIKLLQKYNKKILLLVKN